MENVVHAVCDCNRLQQFWPQVVDLCKFVDRQISIEKENKIFGVFSKINNHKMNLSNLLVSCCTESNIGYKGIK